MYLQFKSKKRPLKYATFKIWFNKMQSTNMSISHTVYLSTLLYINFICLRRTQKELKMTTKIQFEKLKNGGCQKRQNHDENSAHPPPPPFWSRRAGGIPEIIPSQQIVHIGILFCSDPKSSWKSKNKIDL